MAYKVIILYQLYMPSYFLGTFTEYPDLLKAGWNSQAPNCSLQLNKMVSRLRKLLKGDHSVYILTEKPLGYWLKIEQ